jgi:glycosyltransferase involved in cell wall biosynthesis
MKPRVLMVAFHFPPQGGGGVQRSVGHVRYLPEAGYEPVVVTGPRRAEDRWTPSDPTLADAIGSVEVLRADGAPPSVAGGRAARWLGAPMPFDRWWSEAALPAARRAGPVDLVYASMSPWASGRVAAARAAELGCPWVADLRDPWALDEMTVYPTRLHRLRAERTMEETLRSAAAIVMNVPEATRALLERFPGLGDRPVLTIPNGYDPIDFAELQPPRQEGPLRIVHTGFLHTEIGGGRREIGGMRRRLGGAVKGVDIVARSHVDLMAAIHRLIDGDPRIASAVELHLAGALTEADEAAAASPVTRLHGYLSHADSIALMRSADLLFLPMHGLPAGRRARIVPGKTYEYLAARRPILATVPDGDAHDLFSGAPQALVCRPGDVDGIARALARELARPRPAPPGPPPPRALERRDLAARLAATFDRVLGRSGEDQLVAQGGIESFGAVWDQPPVAPTARPTAAASAA